jgi:alkylation response protein AidB-like acyl-CoA dehydrogenase
MAFRLLGETGAHAPILNDVVLLAAGRGPGETVPLPHAGGSWVVWERSDRRAVGWWLAGTGRAMLALEGAEAALTAARHCQQVLGGIGFTAEHGLNRHVRRALVLDGLLGSARELTREAGAASWRSGPPPAGGPMRRDFLFLSKTGVVRDGEH